MDIEKVKNLKEVKPPEFQTYYQIFSRDKGGTWSSGLGILYTKEIDVLNDYKAKMAYAEANASAPEVKIISFELPF